MIKFSSRKVLLLILGGFIGINILGFFLLNYKIDNLQKDNKNKDMLLNKKNNVTESSKPKQECDFVRTFYVISVLDNYEIDPDYIYIVVDQFQVFEPEVLKISKKIAKDVEEGNFYEFLFHGNDSSSIKDLEIINCSKTKKEGLEQRQESCS